MGALITILYLVISYFINLDIIRLVQGSRFFTSNATVVSTISIFLSTQTPFIYSMVGYISGILSGSIIFIVFLIRKAFSSTKNLIYLVLISSTSLYFIKNTTAGYKLFQVIDSLKTLNIADIFNSTTLKTRIIQLSDVSNYYKFNDIFGENLFSWRGSQFDIESGLFYFYAYGGIIGTIINLLLIIILLNFCFPNLKKYPFILFIIILYGIALNPLASAACQLYLVLFIESNTLNQKGFSKK